MKSKYLIIVSLSAFVLSSCSNEKVDEITPKISSDEICIITSQNRFLQFFLHKYYSTLKNKMLYLIVNLTSFGE